MDLSAQLDRLEANHPPIPIESVDFTIKRPELLRRKLGKAFAYFGRVESEVERNVDELEILLPNADDNTKRFYQIWSDQELPHGDIFEQLQRELGLTPDAADLNTMSRTIKIGGFLAKHVRGAEPVLMQSYLVTGALHEKTTATGYDLLIEMLEHLGERDIVGTGIRPIRQQESGHYAYYRNAAIEHHAQLSDYQKFMVQLLKGRSYTPVGAGTDKQRADFGGVIRALGAEDKTAQLALPTQRTAEELLMRPGDTLGLPQAHPVVARLARRVLGAREDGLLLPLSVEQDLKMVVEMSYQYDRFDQAA